MTRREKYFTELEVRTPHGALCLFHNGVVRWRVYGSNVPGGGVAYLVRFKKTKNGTKAPYARIVRCKKLIALVKMKFFPMDVGL